ncbi:Vacuolar_protein [Hexamita inflata]|uniref:Vacuolar protein n=1 Tax=Hexamita inflata TaxID=28002 RepID=A0AA86V749_9EUKA|nr:Vacuolar protein [Hexamita inflata]
MIANSNDQIGAFTMITSTLCGVSLPEDEKVSLLKRFHAAGNTMFTREQRCIAMVRMSQLYKACELVEESEKALEEAQIFAEKWGNDTTKEQMNILLEDEQDEQEPQE